MLNQEIFLNQRHFLRWHHYRAEQDGIGVTENAIYTVKKYKVPYENIPKEPREVTISSNAFFWATVILLLLSVITGLMQLLGQNVARGTFIIWGLCGVLTMLAFVASRQSFVVYTVSNNAPGLVLFKNNPSKEALERFLVDLQSRKVEYLRSHYILGSESSGTADTIQRLKWLLSQGAINEQEFETLKTNAIEKERWGMIPPPPSTN